MKFEIIHEIKGTRKTEAVVPDSVQLPDDWSDRTTIEKDAWIYENQSASQLIFEDIHHAEAYSVEWMD